MEEIRRILSHGKKMGPGLEACARRVSEMRGAGNVVTPKIAKRRAISARSIMRELWFLNLGKTPIQAKLKAANSQPGSWRNLLDGCGREYRASNRGIAKSGEPSTIAPPQVNGQVTEADSPSSQKVKNERMEGAP